MDTDLKIWYRRKCYIIDKTIKLSKKTTCFNWKWAPLNIKNCYSFVHSINNYILNVSFRQVIFETLPKKGNAKECSNYCTIAFISHASKVIFKILQARLQQYVNRELLDVQASFRKGRGTRDQIAKHPLDHGKSKRVPEKRQFLLYWLCQSLWLCGSQ